LQDGIEIHFGHDLPAIEHPLFGDGLEPLGQHIGFDAPMGFDHADNNVNAVQSPASRRCEHLESFSNPWGRAEEDFETPSALPVRLLEQNFG
jgi:hypothetical protein